MRILIACGLLVTLAACGSRKDLSLEQGQQLPPAPYGRAVKPTPIELLATPPLAIPERSVELRTRSEKRDDDPFDLPPPDTGN
jgi:hypothetical protein